MADQTTPSQANPIRVVVVDVGGNIVGSIPVTIADNGDFALGSVTDAAWVAGDGTAIALLKTIASGGGGGSGPVTIIDGGDVAEGAKADAAVITDTTGTVSGKLRGLVKWAFERMPASLGQKVMASSLPVVIASDQSAVPVSGAVSVSNFTDNGLTDTQLRASAVPVSGPLTDTQLRATPVPVSAAVTATVLPVGAATPTDGVVTNTIPGAPTQLPSVVAKLVAITASLQNVDDVVVGSSTVSASKGSGITLSPGDAVTMPVTSLANLYVDCRVPGDGIAYLVLA